MGVEVPPPDRLARHRRPVWPRGSALSRIDNHRQRSAALAPYSGGYDMIRSRTAPDGAAATVTFTLAHAGLDGHRVAVVGDFNGWDPGATPMEGENGSHTATVTLE